MANDAEERGVGAIAAKQRARVTALVTATQEEDVALARLRRQRRIVRTPRAGRVERQPGGAGATRRERVHVEAAVGLRCRRAGGQDTDARLARAAAELDDAVINRRIL